MAKPKKAKKNPLIRKGTSAARSATKSAGNSKLARKSKAALGIGKRIQAPRGATAKDIRRKGISLLKGANSALARFIAIRYSAKAIAKYQDYGLRLRRSKRLRGQVVKIDDATYRIKGYIIRTSTDGLTPYNCTCPDFSQFTDDDRNWLGSKAGPFNPCKHMMAVRDRNRLRRGCTDPLAINYDPTALEDDGSCFYTWGWNCSGGECFEASGSFGTYPTQEACLAARVRNYNPPAAGERASVVINSNVSTGGGLYPRIYEYQPIGTGWDIQFPNPDIIFFVPISDITITGTEIVDYTDPQLGGIGSSLGSDRYVLVKANYTVISSGTAKTNQIIAILNAKQVIDYPSKDWTINSFDAIIHGFTIDGIPDVAYSCPI